MNSVKDERKFVTKSNKSTIKRKENILKSMYYMIYFSVAGIFYAFKEEKSFRIHLVFGFLLPISLAITSYFVKCPLNIFEWAIVVGNGGLLLAIETINSGIENTVDLFTQDYHEYAKRAKDQGSGAVCIIGLITLVFNFIIFLPRLIGLF